MSGEVTEVFAPPGEPRGHQRSRFVELRTADGQRVLAEVDPRGFDPPIVLNRGDYVQIIGQPTRIGGRPVLDAHAITDIGALERERQERIRQFQPPGLQRDLRRDLHRDLRR